MVNIEKIKTLCKERGLSLYSLEKSLGMGNGTIGKWGLPNRKPNLDNVMAVANALGVSVSELTNESKKISALKDEDGLSPSESETKLISLFRLLPEDMQDDLLAQIEAVLVRRGLLP